MNFQTYQVLVTKKAAASLEDRPWYRGICVDNIHISYPDVDRGVDIAVSDTEHYDGPRSMSA